MRFSIGQRVICIDDVFPAQFFEWGSFTPAAGEIYTVRAIHWSQNPGTGRKGLGVHLEEIVNPTMDGAEVYFAVERFRPLEEQDALEEGQKAAEEPEVVAV